MGVSRSTWSRIEAGSSALNMDQLAKAASALGVPLGELMLEVDKIVRELRRQDVEVHDSRDQAVSASGVTGAGKAGGGNGIGAVGGPAAVAFLGGAVLGGVIAALLAKRSSQNTPQAGTDPGATESGAAAETPRSQSPRP